ncbi:histidine kinase dimerization/phospho-acceptor domain-containing protein, partial [Vibrio parahaemolyticus]
AEQRQAEQREQIFHTQKLAAVGRLSGGIAPDFNNLLLAMLGYAAFIHSDLPEGSRQREFAAQILRAGERAKGLVQQILAFSRAQELP